MVEAYILTTQLFNHRHNSKEQGQEHGMCEVNSANDVNNNKIKDAWKNDGGNGITSQSMDVGSVQFSSVQSLSCVRLFAARQASLSITNSWSSLRFTSIESGMPSSHLMLCYS